MKDGKVERVIREFIAGFSGRSKFPDEGRTIVAVNGTASGNRAASRTTDGAGAVRSRGRVTVLRDRDFARFFAGYATSLLGTSMSSRAVSFAVLDDGGTASDLGLVLAAGIVPQVLFMLGGGVIADRLGRRPVMLGADAARCAAQAALAGAVLTGRPALWVFILLAVARGAGDAVFTPALTGLTVELAPPDDLVNANALLTAARSAAAVAGPGLAGVLVALAGPGTVIALDAGSYGVSVLALASLRLPSARPTPVARPVPVGPGSPAGPAGPAGPPARRPRRAPPARTAVPAASARPAASRPGPILMTCVTAGLSSGAGPGW